jgi:hypothetical protein
MGFVDGFKGAVTGATAALGMPHIALPIALFGDDQGTKSYTAKGTGGAGDAPGPDPAAVHNNPYRAEREGGCWCWRHEGCDHRPWICALVLCERCNGSGLIVEILRQREEVDTGQIDEAGEPILEWRCVEYEREQPCPARCDVGLVPWHETSDADDVYHYSGTVAYTRFSYTPPDDAGPPPEVIVADDCG